MGGKQSQRIGIRICGRIGRIGRSRNRSRRLGTLGEHSAAFSASHKLAGQ